MRDPPASGAISRQKADEGMAEPRIALLSDSRELIEAVRVALSFAGLPFVAVSEAGALDAELAGDDPPRGVLIDLASGADPAAVAEQVRSVPVGADVAVFFLGSGEGPIASTDDALAAGGDAYFALPAEAARVLARLATYLDVELPRIPASLELPAPSAPGSLAGLAPPLDEEPPPPPPDPPPGFDLVDDDGDEPEVTAEIDPRMLSRLHEEAAAHATGDGAAEDEGAPAPAADTDVGDDEDEAASDIARRVQRLRSRLAEGRGDLGLDGEGAGHASALAPSEPSGLVAPEGAFEGDGEDDAPDEEERRARAAAERGFDALTERITEDDLQSALAGVRELAASVGVADDEYPPLDAMPSLEASEEGAPVPAPPDEPPEVSADEEPRTGWDPPPLDAADDDEATTSGFLAPPPTFAQEQREEEQAQREEEALAAEGADGDDAAEDDADDDVPAPPPVDEDVPAPPLAADADTDVASALDAALAPPALHFPDAEVGPLLDELGLTMPPAPDVPDEDGPATEGHDEQRLEEDAVTGAFPIVPREGDTHVDGPLAAQEAPEVPEQEALDLAQLEALVAARVEASLDEVRREVEERVRLEAQAALSEQLEERVRAAVDEARLEADERVQALEEERVRQAEEEERLREELAARLEEAEEQVEALRTSADEARRALEDRLQRDADEKVAALATDLADAERRLREEEARRQTLEEERVQQAEEEERLREELEAALASLRADADERLAEAERKSAEALSRAGEAEERAAAAEKRADEAESRIAEAEARAAAAEQRAGEAEQRVAAAEQRAGEAEQRVAEAEERAAEAGTRAAEAETRATDAETRAAEAETRAADAVTRAEEAEARAGEAGARAAEAEARTTRAEEQAAQTEARATDAASRAAEAEARAEALETRAAELERERSALEGALSSLQQELEERVAAAARERADLEATLRAEAELKVQQAAESARRETEERLTAAAAEQARAAAEAAADSARREAEERLLSEAEELAFEAAEAARRETQARLREEHEEHSRALEERVAAAELAAREAEERAVRVVEEERVAREELEEQLRLREAELARHRRRWGFRPGAALGGSVPDGDGAEGPHGGGGTGASALGVGRISWWGADPGGAPLGAVTFAPGGELSVEPPPPPESWVPLDPPEGELGEGELPSLLWSAHVLEVTGALVLEDKRGLVRTLYLERGEPVGFASDLSRDRPEEALLRAGLITAAKHTELRAGPLRSARRACAHLVDEGALKPQELFTAVRGVLSEQVLSLLELAGGSFRYEREAAHAADRVRLQHGFDALLAEGVRRKYDLPRLWRVLGGAQTLVGKDDRAVRLPPLTPSERAALALLDGQRSLEDAVLDGSLPAEDVLRAALIGIACGAARVIARGVPGAPVEQRLDHERALAIDKARIEDRLHAARHGDYFAFLGIAPESTSFEVRRAADNVRRQFDPRRYSDPAFRDLKDALDEIRQVADEAEAVLSDDALRAGYLRGLVSRRVSMH